MADTRFFKTAGPFTLGRLVRELRVEPADDWALERSFVDVAPLESAGPTHVSFFHNRAYLPALRETKAAAVLVAAQWKDDVPARTLALVVSDPHRAFGQLSVLFHPISEPAVETTVHPSAFVDETAVLGQGVRVEPFAVIAANVEIGAGTVVGAHCTIAKGVHVGEGCTLDPHCTLSHCILGDRVYLKPGARLGQGGFGWAVGTVDEGHQRIPQLGRLLVGDDVEVGANSTLDRGTGPDTIIGAGTVIDNQCQIAHNVQLGRGCVIAGNSAIGGSARLEDGCLMGGCTTVLGHLTLGAGSQVHISSTVTKTHPPGSILRGVPARDHRLYRRQEATLRQLAAKTKKGAKDASD